MDLSKVENIRRILGQFSNAAYITSPTGVQIDRRIAQILSFTFSIANGAVFGFISFAGLKLFTGCGTDVPLLVLYRDQIN